MSSKMSVISIDKRIDNVPHSEQAITVVPISCDQEVPFIINKEEKDSRRLGRSGFKEHFFSLKIVEAICGKEALQIDIK